MGEEEKKPKNLFANDCRCIIGGYRAKKYPVRKEVKKKKKRTGSRQQQELKNPVAHLLHTDAKKNYNIIPTRILRIYENCLGNKKNRPSQ